MKLSVVITPSLALTLRYVMTESTAFKGLRPLIVSYYGTYLSYYGTYLSYYGTYSQKYP